jgi:hypothetical protein
MQVYLAYKYQNHANKRQLQGELEELADIFAKNGHQVFLLGRDIQHWNHNAQSKWSTFVEIWKNIKKYKTLFVYNDSNVHSNGLPLELILAKIFGLQILYSVKKGINNRFYELFANSRIEFTDFADLKNKVHNF